MKKIFTLALILSFTQLAYSQLALTTTQTAEWYVKNVLLGQGINVSNIKFTGDPLQICSFANGATTNLGLDEGIVLAGGNANVINGPNNTGGSSGSITSSSYLDPDLQKVLNGSTSIYDIAVLEFDFVPTGKNLEFQYVFGSEEYPEYVGGSFNDIFGFFISGPGISGPYSNNGMNIALLPGTGDFVSINNVNINKNSQYYINNAGGATIQYDAFTTVLTAKATVQPCQTYHIKLTIADVGDHSFDSGVCLKAGSFSSPSTGLEVVYTNPTAYQSAVEACSNAYINVDVGYNVQSDTTINYKITGTAKNGIDYTTIPGYITIPKNSHSATIVIDPISDNIKEQTENIKLEFTFKDPCLGVQKAYAKIAISDGLKIKTDTQFVLCNATSITPNVNDVGYYNWYADNNTSSKIATSVDNNPSSSIPLSQITDVTGTAPNRIFKVYVEKIDSINGYLRDDLSNFTFDDVTLVQPSDNKAKLYFNAEEPFNLESIDIRYLSSVSTNSLTVYIYSGAGTIVGSKSFNLPVTSTIPAVYTLNNLNISIPKGMGYYIGFGGSGVTLNWTSTGTLNSFPEQWVIDNHLIATIVGPNSSIGYPYSTPYIFNWKFNSVSIDAKTCGRFPVVIKEICNQCEKPTSLTFNILNDTIMCEKTDLNLNAQYTLNQNPLDKYYYSWYKDGSLISQSTTYSDFQITATSTTDAGIYTLRIEDGNNNESKCYLEKSTDVVINPLPNIDLGTDQTICQPNSYTFDAGTGIDAYAWSTGETTQTIAPKTSGTYSVTVTTKNCSSSDDVNLTVNPLPIINLGADQTICEPNAYTFDAGTSIDAYAWSTGETTQTIAPKTSGTYSVTVTTKNCSSSDDVNLTVNPLPIINLGADQTICEPNAYTFDAGTGIDAYAWSTGETTQTIAPKTSGTYSVTVTTKNCSSSDDVNLTVNPLPIINLGADQTICEPNAYTFDAGTGIDAYAWSTGETTQTIAPKATGTYSVTVTTKNCSSSDDVNLTVNPLPIINLGADQTICEPNSYTFDAGTGIDAYAWSTGETAQTIAPKTSGTYSVTVTTKNCSSSDDVNLTVNPLPIINLGADQTICEPNAYTFDAGIGIDAYAWNTGETTQTIAPNATGNYSVTVTTKGCSSSDNVNLTVVLLPVIDAGIDTTICDGTSFTRTITTESGVQYLWSNGDAGSQSDIAKAGTYTISATNSNGCLSTDNFNVKVVLIPKAPKVWGDTILCYYETQTTLYAKGSNLTWYADNGIVTGDSLQVTVSNNPQLVFHATQTDYKCESPQATITVTQNPKYTGLEIGAADTAFCEYDATDKLFIGHGYFTNNWWTVSGNNVIEKNNITSNVVSVDFVKPGLSVLKLSTIDTDGCYFETTKSIVVTPKPTADFEYMAGNKQRVYFKNTSDTAWVDGLEHPSPNNYVWSFDLENSKFTPFNGNDTIIQYQYGYHDVQLIAINNTGCKDTITQTIFTDCVRRLYIPTAFSPTNETATELKIFKPKGIGLKAFKIWVYDIWGNLLWYSDQLVNNQPAESWDGIHDGQTMKLDTYIWKVEAVFLDGSEWEGQDGATSKQHCVFGNVILI